MWLIGNIQQLKSLQKNTNFHKGANHVEKKIKIYKVNNITYVHGAIIWLQ
jgi:4-hydroxyphenylpyruvate dioxygenase-like putative hemolysin